MNIKARQLQITDEKPFQDDVLNRKESAEILTELIGTITEPFVIAIDSPWGTGKTTFLEMWRKLLRQKGSKCLFFNAWQNDFSDSPMVSLIAEVGVSLKHMGLNDEDLTLARKAYDATKEIGAKLIKAAIPISIKLGTAGILEAADLDIGELASASEKWAKKQIERHEEHKHSIEDFRNRLETFVSSINKKTDAGIIKPVVFIIDELDRCRPDYAVALLEKLKHLFNVPGLVFVLAMDMQQLGESVKSVYGSGMNAKEYLRKFIDLQYHLPEVKVEDYIGTLFSRFGFDDVLGKRTGVCRGENEELKQCLAVFFTFFHFSLRTQEQCMTQLSVILRTVAPNHFLYPYLLSFLLCLRAEEKHLYVEYVQGRATVEDVRRFLRDFEKHGRKLPDDSFYILEAHLVYGLRNQSDRQAQINYYNRMAVQEKPGNPALSQFALVVKHFEWMGATQIDITGYLYKKIEIAQRFTQ
jgi:hypothetical protein